MADETHKLTQEQVERIRAKDFGWEYDITGVKLRGDGLALGELVLERDALREENAKLRAVAELAREQAHSCFYDGQIGAPRFVGWGCSSCGETSEDTEPATARAIKHDPLCFAASMIAALRAAGMEDRE